MNQPTYRQVARSRLPDDCEAIHPRNPDLRCNNATQCVIDWHLATVDLIDGNRTDRVIVSWGAAVEDYAPEFGFEGIIISIADKKPINTDHLAAIA